MTNLANVVLDDQGHVRGHGERHLAGQARRLREHVQVPGEIPNYSKITKLLKINLDSAFSTKQRKQTKRRKIIMLEVQQYLQAKVRVTGSCISMMTASSSLSTFAVWASLILPVPISPAAENLTPSLVQLITTDSPN